MGDRDPSKATEYRVTLRFAAGGAPAIVRLRRFLKMAWRAYGLKAVRVEEVPGDGPGPTDQGEGRPDGPT